MKSWLCAITVAGFLLGCQSKPPTTSLEVRDQDTQTTVSVAVQTATPSPAAGALEVRAEGNSVNMDASGIKVQSSDGSKVEVSQQGIGVSVGEIARQDDESLIIDGVGNSKTYEVNNQSVVINGTQHRLKFTGKVTDLTVNGTGNEVEVAEVQEIVVNGTNNRVDYLADEPEVVLNGIGNTCQRR